MTEAPLAATEEDFADGIAFMTEPSPFDFDEDDYADADGFYASRYYARRGPFPMNPKPVEAVR